MREALSARVRHRAAREADLPAAADVFLESVEDMYARHGIRQLPPPREVIVASYGHILRTGVFELAEIDGRIAGIAGAVLRDRLWFLSAFWVRPGLQGQGVGGPLLDRVWRDGERGGAATYFTYSSVDTSAMAAYMRRGLVPGWPVLAFGGVPRIVPPPPSAYSTSALDVPAAAAIDREVRGAAREADHAWWLGGATPFHGRLVTRGTETVGYCYAAPGYTGSVAWTDPAHAEAVMAHAFRAALDLAPELKLFVPGVNHAAIRFALATHMRLTGFSHLLTTGPFGRMDRYLASGPSLF